MGRIAKPWWREQCNAYYATVNGVQCRLGTSLKEANETLKRLRNAAPEEKLQSDSVSAVLDDFLNWTHENRAPKTYTGYLAFCQSFTDHCGDLPVSEIDGKHVTAWLNTKTTWNTTTKHDAVTCLKRAFNWAVKNRGLKANPIAGMEKPEAKTRTETVTLEEFKAILRTTRDREFRDLIRFSWEVGCRPQEARQIEHRHIDLAKRRCVIPASEGKKKRLRVIYLPEKALVIVKRRMQTTGDRLFLNTRGKPWTGAAVKCRFAKMEEKLGRRYFQYMFRHSWITAKLKAGVDSHVVGALAGHADTKMIDRVYSHVAEDHDFMLSQAEKK